MLYDILPIHDGLFWVCTALVLLTFLGILWARRRPSPNFSLSHYRDRSSAVETAFRVTCRSRRRLTYGMKWSADPATVAPQLRVTWGRTSVSGYLPSGIWLKLHHQVPPHESSSRDRWISTIYLIFTAASDPPPSSPVPIRLQIAWPCRRRPSIRADQSYTIVLAARPPSPTETATRTMISSSSQISHNDEPIQHIRAECAALASRIGILEERSSELRRFMPTSLSSETPHPQLEQYQADLGRIHDALSSRMNELDKRQVRLWEKSSQLERYTDESADASRLWQDKLQTLQDHLELIEGSVHQLQEDIAWLHRQTDLPPNSVPDLSDETTEEIVQRLLTPLELRCAELEHCYDILSVAPSLHDKSTQSREWNPTDGNTEEIPELAESGQHDLPASPEAEPEPATHPIAQFMKDAYIQFNHESLDRTALPTCEEYAIRLQRFFRFILPRAEESLPGTWASRIHIVRVQFSQNHVSLNPGSLHVKEGTCAFSSNGGIRATQTQLFKLFLGVQTEDGQWLIYLPPGPFDQKKNTGDYIKLIGQDVRSPQNGVVVSVDNPATFSDIPRPYTLVEKMTLSFAESHPKSV